MNQPMSRESLKQEALAQSRLFDSLKGWLKTALHVSTLSLVLALFGSNIHIAVQIIGILSLILSILAALVIGFALKRGRDNLTKLFTLIDAPQAVCKETEALS